jgi:hypothetical protein
MVSPLYGVGEEEVVDITVLMHKHVVVRLVFQSDWLFI